MSLFSKFGNFKKRVKNAISDLKNNKGIIIIDDKNRENESDLVFSAETMTTKQMAFMIRYGSGIVCLCITDKKRKKLDLPMMVKNNTNNYKTGFTISIESAKDITTGVSAQDRLKTIKTAIASNAQPHHLNKPGHIFPLRAHVKGIKYRPGHTESSIEIMKLAGFRKYSVICELTKKNGSMFRIEDSLKFSKIHNIQIVFIKDIIKYLSLKKNI
ncbi:3,4-dihydroxy-2-butanone-4-phosphate synthase [Buchnera aphidicola]|uniref:3,4-dihydroxy-2-butanone-4-phosphate synthase n=1 Tax=Buchnera aphidicola TaxID=9 RepID=UPI00223715AE|nr:3,4-dihydroxy-2-butanone-4-phosphate synthase [Buchnera aphidicola]MCW5197379.1 3,4-dihydroxy-2-butanone-4-phosphate synthase [Buchnera aphidicola (Chaitophorus viminalis)]